MIWSTQPPLHSNKHLVGSNYKFRLSMVVKPSQDLIFILGQTTTILIADRVINQNYVHPVPGKGMPIIRAPGTFGDLLVK